MPVGYKKKRPKILLFELILGRYSCSCSVLVLVVILLLFFLLLSLLLSLISII